jgi:hypothetical protein
MRDYKKKMDQLKLRERRGFNGRPTKGRGGSGGGFSGSDEWQAYMEESQEEAASIGYETALDMCVNNGQVSVVESIGWDGYFEALTSESIEVLFEAASHPEAIDEEIIPESYQEMMDFMEFAEQDFGAKRGK